MDIQEYLPTVSNYTLIDVTSVATSAFVVRGGAIMGHADAKIGWRAVLTELAAIHGTTPAEALSRVRMVVEDVCTNELCQSVLQALSKIEPKFVDAYGGMFSELIKDKKVPATVILITPPELGIWFSNILSRIDFSQFTISEQLFSVHQLHEEHLVKKTEIITTLTQDAGIAAAAAFMHIRARDKTLK